ncbi:MAG: transporter substrate-binding domain-containing protein [Lactobacillaceae bacterium]|jgi:putative glutamine transport system substrate-binding protein|nr:transporter substrate-binding domain-containing protein [Lactobacillaceae bacterium]
MEKAKKRQFGIVATLISILIFFGAITIMAIKANTTHQGTDTLERVKNAHIMTWGVKADTKLFGLMDTNDGQIKGFDVDIAKAVTKQIASDLNITIEPIFVQVTSSTRIQLLKNGNIDAFAATATATPERKKVADFSKPYFSAGQSILVPTKENIKSVKDLNKADKTILGVVGANSIINIKKFAPKAKILALNDYAQAMTALKAGQGDAITSDNGILYGMSMENKGYVVAGEPFTNEPYSIAFDKDQVPITKATNKALDEIIKNGSYNKLIKKWFSKVPGMNWRSLER